MHQHIPNNYYLCLYSISLLLNMLLVSLAMRNVLLLDIKKRIYYRGIHETTGSIATNLGGVALFIPFFIVNSILNHWLHSDLLHVILAATTLIFFSGLRDDLVKFKSNRLAGVELVSILLILLMERFRLDSLHGLFGIYAIPAYVGYTLTGLIMLLTLGFAKRLDKIEGLLPSIAGGSFTMFGLSFAILNEYGLATICFGLAGSLFGFIWFQRGKRQTILGKAGCLLVGFLLGYMSIFLLCFKGPQTELTNYPLHKFILNIPFAISFILLPLFDLIRRLCLRVFLGVRWHYNMAIQDSLLQHGYSKIQITLLIGAINVVLVGTLFYMIHCHLGINTIISILGIFTVIVLLYLSRFRRSRYLDDIKLKK